MQLNIAIESITLEFIEYEDDNIAPTCGYFLQEYINNTLEYVKLPSIFKEFALRFSNIGIYNAMQIFDFSQILVNTQEMVIFGENEIQLL
ncbi:1140_t:CDS:2, partial [Gigaspora margarita]